jgi:hypothetical protein
MFNSLLEIEKTKSLPAPVLAPPSGEAGETGMPGGILLGRDLDRSG